MSISASRSHDCGIAGQVAHSAFVSAREGFAATIPPNPGGVPHGDTLPWSTSSGLGGIRWRAMIAGGTISRKTRPCRTERGEHPVHLRHHRPSQGAMLTHRNLLNNGNGHGKGGEATEKDPYPARRCPLPLFRVGDWVDGVGGIGAALILLRRSSTRWPGWKPFTASGPPRSMAFPRCLSRDELSRIRPLRPDFAAHRRDGGSACVPSSLIEAGGRERMHMPESHCVWTDGIVAGITMSRGRRFPELAVGPHRGDACPIRIIKNRSPQDPTPWLPIACNQG